MVGVTFLVVAIADRVPATFTDEHFLFHHGRNIALPEPPNLIKNVVLLRAQVVFPFSQFRKSFSILPKITGAAT